MTPFLKEVAADLIAKFGNELHDCAIVFNNKRPASYLKKYLADHFQKPFWSPSFYAIQEFFATQSELKIADHHTQFFTLYDCYCELLLQEGISEAPDISKFHHIAKIILGDFAQIDNDLVDANKLFLELEDIAVINQQFDFLTQEQKEFLSQFWQSYSDGKYKRQQERFIQMWHRMPILFHQFHSKLAADGFVTMPRLYREIAEGKIDYTAIYNHGKLVFVGFNALSKAESKAFKRWQDEGKATFYFDTDAYYFHDETQEAGLFLRKNINQIGLINQLKERDSDLKSHREVNVYKVQGHTAQAKIMNHLLEGDLGITQQSSTAIILADESLLIPILQTIPTTMPTGEQIELNVTIGFGLANSTLFGLIDLWLAIQAEMKTKKTVQYQKVEAFLTHPLTGISERMRPKIIDALIKEQLAEIPFERLTRQGGLFSLFFKPNEDVNKAVFELITLLDKVLERELAARNLKEIDAALFEKTRGELVRLDDNLSLYLSHYHDLDLGFVLSLIQKSLSGITVALEGDPLKGLQVMGLLESRNLNFERVIVVGLNEGIVPQTSQANTFVPDSLRRAYGLPVLENQDAISAYMFYRLIQRAEKIDFVYNSLTDESNSGEPSRFIKQLAYESGFNFNYKELQLQVKTELKREEVVVKSERVQAVLGRYLTGEKYLSASALTTYISNPIDFFYKYVAGIEEPKEVKETVEAYKVGLILHDVMEQFYSKLMKESADITSERILNGKKIVPGLIEQAFSAVMYEDRNIKLHLNGMQKVIYAIVQEYVNIILEQDIADSPFTLVGLEQKGSINFEILVDGELRQLKLFGIIDRVDLKNGIYRIVDYKTGSDKLKYSSIAECFDTDCGNINKALVQTLFYTHVYERSSKNDQVEPNLYIVKSMKNEGVHFTGQGGILKDAVLASEKEIFLTALKTKLEELFNYELPFRASLHPGNYAYSIYTTLFAG